MKTEMTIRYVAKMRQKYHKCYKNIQKMPLRSKYILGTI